MRLTDESKLFHDSVYLIVTSIPYGKVTSYGHIAYLLNRPQNSRQVGYSLKHCKAIMDTLRQDGELLYSYETLPWWRVLLSSGTISPRATSGEYVQATKLAGESVIVLENHKVDLTEYGWFPDEVDF
ncbi:uncharacterized protein CANTADRAFT_25545 [Suhomyces tanzawaensis NRRL Y-17324]|uniref:6-O-methylguanine-DNA methyltransferase n=1 Tax=Suhomyces tanzawaensis NRRL Y-17324 TaxID=984487 RepID=A0A1E4SJC9_9ASCO|nr:uncharacterized protein CANTADRAFT_25545 [Suhomyces tanzawaensis NRRL Y-17324]ODV79609.1 hypothetical protein CANTADRAFT_25545 [Suhomyces tanzawaensis NRRL Y-17324]